MFFSWINTCQVPSKDVANRGRRVNALKNYVRSILLHKNGIHLLHFTLFWHYFVSPFHQCLANVILNDYARSAARQ